MPDSTEIESLVIESIRQLAEDFDLPDLRSIDRDSPLYGTGGPLDSMMLVNLIADLEEAVAERFAATISLTDDRAMSARHSPYRSVNSLSEAIAERIEG